MINKIKEYIKNPKKFILFWVNRGFFNWLPDKLYLKMNYALRMNKKLNIKDPKTYNEKLQWLKLYDRKAEYTNLVDKYEVKKIVSNLIGEEYVIPTLGVWNSFDEIDFNSLPNQFVLKCTHDSGGVFICKDKSQFDLKEARKKIKKALSKNFYYALREWPYKNIKPRIIAEKYMEDESGYELKDYKFFCFNGKAKIMFLATDRPDKTTETKFDFYDMDFKHLPIKNGHPNSEKKLKKPLRFEKMIELAERLSKNMPHIRVDFYNINGKIYFGELTFYHWSGLVPFEPEEWDYKIGEWLKLPKESEKK